MLLKTGIGIGALVAVVIGLGDYAHPKRPNTTPDNEFGLHPTTVCDAYRQPLIADFRGVLWSKSTYERIDKQNPPPLHYCTEQELAMAGYLQPDGGGAAGGYGQAGDGGAPMQKREVPQKKPVSISHSARLGRL